MSTRCYNQDKVLVIDGEAVIVPPRPAPGPGHDGSK
jgi:hypothetical protein